MLRKLNPNTTTQPTHLHPLPLSHLVVYEQLRPLEVPRGHPDIVLLARVVELGEAPVNEAEALVLVVDHNVVGLHVAVHYAHTVAVVQGLGRGEGTQSV